MKVTYLPAEFIRTKRKEKGLPVELTFLKKKAKEAGISFNKSSNNSDIYYEITEKMKDKNDKFCKSVLETLHIENLQVLAEAQQEPKLLSKWLYENQGEMRFGSENRLFLILVDTQDFNSSWKLKRNLRLLKPAIFKYLRKFTGINSERLKITFRYKDRLARYSALSDIIFIVK